MEIREQIYTFITTNFYVPDTSSLADDASLLDHGIIDSTGVLELIGFLEKTFGLTVEDDEMIPENLDSIAGLMAFVAQKKAA